MQAHLRHLRKCYVKGLLGELKCNSITYLGGGAFVKIVLLFGLSKLGS
jgi:hypothetical protein